eukprot:scaffold128252_cov21-Phaeocystis_antarctica.AAC.1
MCIRDSRRHPLPRLALLPAAASSTAHAQLPRDGRRRGSGRRGGCGGRRGGCGGGHGRAQRIALLPRVPQHGDARAR